MTELRLAIRLLRRSPLFVVVATLTLGVGIALSTTMLSMLDAIRHPYVPYRAPERLFAVTAYGGGTSGQVGPYEKHWALIEGARSFEAVAASASRFQARITIAGQVHLGDVSWVTDEYFPLLGAAPEIGRGFAAGQPDDGNAVIGYGLWQRAFQSRPLDRGLLLTVDDRTYRVVGIMPPAMRGGAAYLRFASVWIKVPGDARTLGTPIVRLRDGVSLEAAYAELDVIAARLRAAYGPGRQPFQFRLDPLAPPPRELTDYHKAMGGAAIAILLIACANLANLMLVRGLARRRELSLRLAIGASRGALLRHLLAESAVVGLLGGAAGTVLTVWGIALVRHQLPSQGSWFGFLPPHLSWQVYGLVVATTLGAVLLFGLGPAIAASSVQVSEPLKETVGTTTGRPRRWSTLVVVVEVALCLTLLMGSGLLLRAASRVAAFDFGYPREGLISSQARVLPRGVPEEANVPRAFEDLVAAVARVPGVAQVATSRSVAPRGGAVTSDLEGSEALFANVRRYRAVSWNFLRALGVPLVAGRDFDSGDDAGTAPVAIVSERTARQLWPGVSPVGRMLKLGNPDATAEWVRIVGVARQFSLSFQDDPTMPDYPVALVLQPGDRERLRDVVVRASGDPTLVANQLPAALEAAVPGLYVGGFEGWMPAWQRQRETRGTLSRLFAGFGLLALGLAALGLYGVLAYSVGQRLREFGVRIALGARPGDLRHLVLRDGAVMVLGGTAIGAWVAMAGSYFLDYWLFDVPPTDALSLVGAELMLLVVALAACLGPARRAGRASPLAILRAL